MRSMAARGESNTYAYCTTLFWAILVEFHTVIIPAFLPFLAPTIILQYYEASLINISKVYLIFQFILQFQEYGLYFVQFLFCLPPDMIIVTTTFWAGPRAAREWYSMQYVYLWVMAITILSLIVLSKWHLSMLLLWFIPINVIIYAFTNHAFPYCMHGQAVCPPHTGPGIALMGIGTSLAFVLGYFFCKGCFLFPCLCAPEVPGWLFFPPFDPPSNPLQGDLDYDAFVIMWSKMAAGFPAVEDCVWEAPSRL